METDNRPRDLEDVDLHNNPWLSLRIIRSKSTGLKYVYSHEARCQGRIVALLPYRKPEDGKRLEFLMREEMTPCWSTRNKILSTITGGVEAGQTYQQAAIAELLEETGYTVIERELINLEMSYASKSADTVYGLFSVDLTGKEPGEATGDGTPLDTDATTVWKTDPYLSHDPQASVMWARLMQRLDG